MLRAALKRTAEALAVRSGLTGWRVRRDAPAVVVLAYHNVVPRGERVVGEASLHIEQDRFGRQLDLVAESYDIVPLADAIAAGAEPAPRRSLAVITFDDAYVGTLTAGLEELERRGLPATVFVPPGMLGGDGFWWDLLAAASGGVMEESARDHALWTLEGRQEAVLAWAAEAGLGTGALPDYARPATEAQLGHAAGSGRLSLGSHTWSHVNLAAVDLEAARTEVVRAQEWVDGHERESVRWLAFPYGLRTPELVRLVEEVLDGAFLVEGGLAARRGSWEGTRAALPRMNVPSGLSLEGLSMRLAGLL